MGKGSWRDGRLLTERTVPLHGRLCLMQICTVSGDAFAFDILRLGVRAFDLGLRGLLENPDITKVVHDFRQDADALWHQYRICVCGTFDCQLCDVLVRRLRGHPTKYVQGSAKLFTEFGIQPASIPGYGVLTQEKKSQVRERFSEDRHLWERRPLPHDLVQYAFADVLPLPMLYSAAVCPRCSCWWGTGTTTCVHRILGLQL